MIALDARPRLASKARLRLDRHTSRHMLVYPDRGLELNPSAAAILELCSGDRTVAEIVDTLHARASAAERSDVERDVCAFLQSMLERRLIQVDG
jgi:coenzyme PQQ biosynthesis protein PqqD